jgi:hypothetical protein
MTLLWILEAYCSWRRDFAIVSSTSARVGTNVGAIMGRMSRGGRLEYGRTNLRIIPLTPKPQKQSLIV